MLCEVLGFHITVVKGSGFLGCGAVCMGHCFLAFQMDVLLSSSGVEEARKHCMFIFKCITYRSFM